MEHQRDVEERKAGHTVEGKRAKGREGVRMRGCITKESQQAASGMWWKRLRRHVHLFKLGRNS